MEQKQRPGFTTVRKKNHKRFGTQYTTELAANHDETESMLVVATKLG